MIDSKPEGELSNLKKILLEMIPKKADGVRDTSPGALHTTPSDVVGQSEPHHRTDSGDGSKKNGTNLSNEPPEVEALSGKHA